MRILHLAPFNTAGVPLEFVLAERKLGHESRLVTLARSSQKREEDICLDLPYLDSWEIRFAKALFSPRERRFITHTAKPPSDPPVVWRSGGWMENRLIGFRERAWKGRIEDAIRRHHLTDFDVVQCDGGLEFFRDGRFVKEMKDRGKRLICCYLGSDLRTRGVIPEIDGLCDCRLTVEFDLLRFHPDIRHVPFPVDLSRFAVRTAGTDRIVRIGHAPTRRSAKGSDIIIPIVRSMEKSLPVQLVLIEKLPFAQALMLKSTCDIFIDQIGNLGYGMNGVEALAFGIPTCSSLAPGFARSYPDHPFVEIDAESLRPKLQSLVEDPRQRRTLAAYGRSWVEKTHDHTAVVRAIHRIAGIPQGKR